eukprot:TRINITY_DN4780_c0_g1_i8.p1 TRINITY_DN4780_c0_g1~~TRINITY_DN4780_c0_g1_i8.p1  ORF type:complete len:553 (+),score=42.22 TRINITY_DN4780_c0_g1_i8:209-1660(+)
MEFEVSVPMVVAVDFSGKVVTGDAAVDIAKWHPERAVQNLLALMDMKCDKKLDAHLQHHPLHNVFCRDAKVYIGKAVPELPVLHVWELLSEVFKACIAAVAEVYGEKIDSFVVSIPDGMVGHSWETTPRLKEKKPRVSEQVKASAAAAGISVVRIMSATASRAVAYDLMSTSNEAVIISVYMWRTKFDVSLFDIEDGFIDMHNTTSITSFGCRDACNMTIRDALRSFQKSDVHLANDERALLDLEAQCRWIERSTRRSVPLSLEVVDSTGVSHSTDLHMWALYLEISRRFFKKPLALAVEQMLPLVDLPQMIYTVWGECGDLPAISYALPDMYRLPPKFSQVYGTAKHGAVLGGHDCAENFFEKVDVVPLPLGVGKADGAVHVVVEKYSQTPLKRQATISHKQADLKVYEGDCVRDSVCRLITTLKLPDRHCGDDCTAERQLEVRFEVGEEGALYVAARDTETGEEVAVTAVSDSSGSDESIG